jgi:predicted dehydrogenase
MDKQFARTVADLRSMVEAVRQHRVKVLANYPWSWHPAVREMKRRLDEGSLGRPLALHAQLITTQVRPGLRDPQGLAYRHDTEGGGILHMEGGHFIQAACFLMEGEVTTVTAVCRPVVGFMDGENMDDVSVVGLEFENGAVGNLHAGYLDAVSGTDVRLMLWGSEGSVQWERGSTTLHVKSRRWGEPSERALTVDIPTRQGVYGGAAWTFDIVQDFVNAVLEDREPSVTADDALRVLQVIEAAYESSRSGCRIKVAE